MAYVLLVIGALMSVVGVYATITGYHIVQVEEGWTSVIAGSVLFVGGFLMIGLGLVLRVLLKLQATFVGVPAATPAAGPVSPLSGGSPALPPVPPAKIEPEVENQLLPSRPPRPPIPPLPRVGPPAESPAAPDPAFATAVPIGLAPTPDSFVLPPAAETETPEPTAPVAVVPHPSDDYKLETPSTPEHDLVAAVPTRDPAPSPAEDDWLDRAFAEFDHDLPRIGPSTSAPAKGDPPKIELPKIASIEAAPATASELEPVFAEAEPAETAATVSQPLPPPLPAAPPPMAGPAGTVIGRYESDGTSYVMYADGSIEAQSATGVYRFASMAELKAFIES